MLKINPAYKFLNLSTTSWLLAIEKVLLLLKFKIPGIEKGNSLRGPYIAFDRILSRNEKNKRFESHLPFKDRDTSQVGGTEFLVR